MRFSIWSHFPGIELSTRQAGHATLSRHSKYRHPFSKLEPAHTAGALARRVFPAMVVRISCSQPGNEPTS